MTRTHTYGLAIAAAGLIGGGALMVSSGSDGVAPHGAPIAARTAETVASALPKKLVIADLPRPSRKAAQAPAPSVAPAPAAVVRAPIVRAPVSPPSKPTTPDAYGPVVVAPAQ